LGIALDQGVSAAAPACRRDAGASIMGSSTVQRPTSTVARVEYGGIVDLRNIRDRSMKTLRIAAISIAAAAGSASAAPALVVGDAAAPAARLSIGVYDPAQPVGLEQAQYLWGGRNYCWYPGGWHGPGWYWCGYAWRRGWGWGGPYGWHGWYWHGRGWHGRYGWHGGYDRGWHGGHRGWHGDGHWHR
jgi:hypothetical protein